MKAKYLIVGDVHATPNSIIECEKLFNFVVQTAKQHKVERVIFMGDLLDTHAILHSTVINFYHKNFFSNNDLRFICLVGNHDHPLRNRREHGLVAFKGLENVHVIDQLEHYPDFDAIPYTDNDEFFEIIKNRKHDVLLCHHEFLGSHYENGFYSSHGIPLNNIPYKQIVSGHIHKIQEFGSVKYVGAPRWIHASDANQDRGIWLWDGAQSYQFIDTSEVVGKIIQIKLNENMDLPEINPNLYKQIIVKVTGKPHFIEKVTEKYLGKAEIIPNITQDTDSAVSESLGVNEALKKFILNNYKIQYSELDNEALYKKVIVRLNECGH